MYYLVAFARSYYIIELDINSYLVGLILKGQVFPVTGSSKTLSCFLKRTGITGKPVAKKGDENANQKTKRTYKKI